MATVKKTVLTETKVVDVPAIQLTLSLDEAEAVQSALRYIGGAGAHGRAHTDKVLYALSDAAVSGAKNYRLEGAAYFVAPKQAAL